MSEEEIPLNELVARGGMQRLAASILDLLSDEERCEVFYFYCTYCGRKQYRKLSDKNGCTCMRDD